MLPIDHEDVYQNHQVLMCIVDSGNNASQSKAFMGQHISQINFPITEVGVSLHTSQFALFPLRRPERLVVVVCLITVCYYNGGARPPFHYICSGMKNRRK